MLVRPQLFLDITRAIVRRMGRETLDREPGRKEILTWIGLYTLPWLFAGVSLFYAPQAISNHPGPGYIDALAISTLATLVSLLSTVLPGGLGLKELTVSALLSAWMPFSSALVLALAYRLLHTINELLWALLASIWPRSKMEQPKTEI